MKGLHTIAFYLLIIGGLNWLVLALSGWEIGELLGGQGALLTKAVYVLIGLAAIHELVKHKSTCNKCSVGGGSPQMGGGSQV